MRLILNGDDFGISRGVNAAMIDCYQKGVMNSCSMMTNMPAAKEAAQLMLENPNLSVGIHFNLTVGYPLTKNLKTLVKADGSFNKAMLKDSRHVDPEEIYTELQAQMDRFVLLTGKHPDHINSHHGIEMIQGAEKIICEFSRRYDIPVRRFFTLPEGNHPDIHFEIPLLKFVSKDIHEPGDLIHLYSQEELNSSAIYEYALHPGYVDYEILQMSSLTTGRAYDAHVFLAQEVKDWLTNHPEIQLVNFRSCQSLK